MFKVMNKKNIYNLVLIFPSIILYCMSHNTIYLFCFPDLMKDCQISVRVNVCAYVSVRNVIETLKQKLQYGFRLI